MTNDELKLCNGVGFFVYGYPSTTLIEEQKGVAVGNDYDYYASVLMDPNIRRLIIKIWNMGYNLERVKIGNVDTFMFSATPSQSNDDDNGDEKGYDYKALEQYGISDCSIYNGCTLFVAVKSLIIDLIDKI